MSAKLESIAGPRKGEIVRLSDKPLSIGRDPSNQLAILDSALSRHHCLIEWKEEAFFLRDLDSRNGTLLNGTLLKEMPLSDGDEIKIGASTFVFHASQISFTAGGAAQSMADSNGASTIVLRKEDALYLNSEKRIAEVQPTTRALRDLNALLRISQTINGIHHMEDLEKQILDAIFEVSPADRAAILVANPKNGEIEDVRGWDRLTGPIEEFHYSRTVVNMVTGRKVAVVSNDVLDSEPFNEAVSLLAKQVHCVLAVPMEYCGAANGVIYLEAADKAKQFDETLMELMMAIGSIAGLAFENTRRMEWLEGENQRLKDQNGIEHKMIGDSRQMRAVYQFIMKVAKQEANVLLSGESGTGKELVAKAIHENSPRTYKPFVAINCAAITDTLLESELFGHEKGAFTGAHSQKRGKLEIAEGGTVFLDEIGEMAPMLQAKLLRVLQEREFERVGGTKTIKIDIRLIAATNRDLKEMVKQGRFREDLYYRLDVVSIRMPALRERPEDIPLLCDHFARKFATKTGRRIEGISPGAKRYLLQYAWPGNVRELENAIERAVVMCSGQILYPEDLPENILETAPPQDVSTGSFHGELQGTKKLMVIRALDQSKGNVTDAAKALGVHPNYLHRLMNNLGIEKRRKAVTATS